MAQRTREQREKLAELIAGPVAKKQMTIYEALRTSGYPEAQAKRGWDTVPDVVRQMLPRSALRLVKLGNISPDIQEQLVRGRLVKNTMAGKDGGAQSAKILGSERRLGGGMWQPESNTGIIVLGFPSALTREKMNKMLEEGNE